MSERIDHAAKARYWLPQKGDGITPNHVAVAQVHATLALVEQQRIANLIALADLKEPGAKTQVVADARKSLTVYRTHDNALLGGWYEFHPEIARLLGIGGAE